MYDQIISSVRRDHLTTHFATNRFNIRIWCENKWAINGICYLRHLLTTLVALLTRWDRETNIYITRPCTFCSRNGFSTYSAKPVLGLMLNVDNYEREHLSKFDLQKLKLHIWRNNQDANSRYFFWECLYRTWLAGCNHVMLSVETPPEPQVECTGCVHRRIVRIHSINIIHADLQK